ncbi:MULTISPECIES: potassium transporter Kup [unclassified Polaromonas]|uniref:potassium transporter Kup n=1 Tax=unclassified Polaromonas TaxID=2638319 RepID=UPI0018C96BE8|nr:MULTISPECIES: potassium transporter Kup [unclassified Polaromonas]MBG6073247.1 KUP system potassium uptake protein [Polaromonas sp. CG_9.7]MBG6115243.1 KUP system potassium uptake protein [Polaromonas sp. CG_9.2]MDH6183469.1 KUP system potassium uptake protein [Polaromonas sp. CG_23.6]
MSNKKSSLGALTLGAIGVVYGDIGTSVLYAFKEVFASGHVPITEANILGVLSLFFWTLTIVVSVKYVVLIMRADNHGEGGLMALLALASQSVTDQPRLRGALLMIGVFGVALFFGDGIITPAISVLSAVEGLEILTPAAKPYVVLISLVVLVMLFAVQRRGTADIGKFFGPITVVWFLVIALTGLMQIAQNPQVLVAVLPVHALRFASQHYAIAFITLGAVFLCVTGAEALYADMGHFGKTPIRLAWFGLVMPSLILNYFGQGALVLANPQAAENPFYLMTPDWALIPMVVLATAATVIASQALISGAFSAAKQTIQMGFLPRLTILHTSIRDTGQIYIPAVNWMLLAGVVMAVVLFGSSSALAAAYGISVSLVMVITTLLTFFVVRHGWGYPLWLCIASTGFFFMVDVAFFASNSLKILHGGWFPLVLAAVLYTVMSTWKRGRQLLIDKLRADSIDLPSFLDAVFVSPPVRVEGTAVFMTAEPGIVPNAMLHNLKHNKVLHDQNLFVTVVNHEVPWIGMSKRLEVESLGHDCWQVNVHYGFKNDLDLPKALQQIKNRGCQLEPMKTSYFLSRDTVVPTLGTGMAPWREKLFAQMHHNASGAADFLNLPNNSVVELGSKIEI